ncbi:ATP-binding protein [Aureibacter tunicatorum]|uniref:DNA polymerase III delta prime subunit n=1 Tax=Aureibacter tunicatorum TaxID=866807 RepID=A0AAE4BVK4_9BACT|nr:ATP-binding protein [Aureibacter tunicatorum]MDR6241977.1 DNA polymerase III delta prime subunit [Aureibacter tunicatorum]BDD07530.1 hypothetical protein AUTU_50130 [Aureibacter tunicatorum]
MDLYSTFIGNFSLLEKLVDIRLEELHLNKPIDNASCVQILNGFCLYSDDENPFVEFRKAASPSSLEDFSLILAMASVIAPSLIDKMAVKGNPFSLFRSPDGFLLPSGETCLKLIAGNTIKVRTDAFRFLSQDGNVYFSSKIISLNAPPELMSFTYAPFIVDKDFLNFFLQLRPSLPELSPEFPASTIDTSLNWDDLILEDSVASRLDEAITFVQAKDKLKADYGFGDHMKDGTRMVFHGPSGTGKTLAVALLGKKLDKKVYRVDLSKLVSKFIGETNKNLEKLFDQLEGEDIILFFDEGDAVFGQRNTGSGRSSSHHYANQEIAYLLQRIEDFNGIVIIASNLKKNMDVAFLRRFDHMIYFPFPSAPVREKIWKKFWPKLCVPDTAFDLKSLAKRYEISPAGIINVLKRLALAHVKNNFLSIDAKLMNRLVTEEIYK